MGLYEDPGLPAYVDTTNVTAIAEYYLTHPVPQRLVPVIIVASVAVSVLGSYATLLLLGKRTGNKGIRNVAFLLMAAVTMSSVGIWGMHFIGMHMTLQPINGINWYFSYSPGWTVFSLFAPMLALAAAFLFLDNAESATGALSYTRIALAGAAVGGLIGLMHFSAALSGNFGVSYAIPQTIGAVILAMVATIVALGSFFAFRRQWQDNWLKRLACASILATGVSAMHYLAVSGTSYTVRASSLGHEAALMAGNRRNNVVTIAIGVMCFVIVCFATVLAASDINLAREVRRNSRKVVVASVAFDKSGRLLVKADGSLPMVVLETKLKMSEVMDALDKRQTTFQWLYAISWDWNIVAPFLKAITLRFLKQAQVDAQAGTRDAKVRGRLSKRASLDVDQERNRGPPALADFRDSVIDAASQIARELEIPFEQVGVLYDSVLSTGTRKAAAQQAADKRQLGPYNTERNPRADDESSIVAPSIFGDGEDEQEGVTLFLVRELPTSSSAAGVESAERYRQRGFRVTETRFLAGVLADRFAVLKPDMETLLDSLKVFAKRGTRPVVQPGGVYAGLFGVRPSTSRQGGLDVLVYNFARHQIPAYRLPEVACVTPEMREFLRDLDQLTLDEAGKVCEREALRSSERKKQLRLDNSTISLDDPELIDEEMAIELIIRFQTALYIALDALHNSVRFYPKLATTARISAEVLEVPSSLDDSTPPAEMILVQAVLPEERAVPASFSSNNGLPSTVIPSETPSSATPFVFTPYTLFAKSQMMLLRGRQADDFEHEVLLDLRRRYPSSLMQEAEEKALPHPALRRHGSVGSDFHVTSSADLLHKDKTGSGRSIFKAGPATNWRLMPVAIRRWASRFSSRHSAVDFDMSEGAHNQQHRMSFHSSRSRTMRLDSATDKDFENGKLSEVGHDNSKSSEAGHEMSETGHNTGVLPVLRRGDERNTVLVSPGSTLVASETTSPPNCGNAAHAAADASPHRHKSSQRPDTANTIASLGIRRFTQDGGAAAFAANYVTQTSQSKFARAPEEDQIEEESFESGHNSEAARGLAAPLELTTINASSASSPTKADVSPSPSVDVNRAAAIAFSTPRADRIATAESPLPAVPKTPTRAPNRRVHGSGQRPFTAPASSRRPSSARPHTADPSKSPVLSQRHAVNSTHQNEASMMARLRSDDWAQRQLRCLERGANASNLLGVDY
ncbi:hypothetical protein IE81DRAFT_2818 [Ceraceosorus guamensis]|uniref:MHYT domain-containing protein n=1 Tax=Ceraceosorus guamensis TaxID=1522189 RepID=A0A316WEX3_9BASI|nr:hypothetical protein IE81DRAFT_2818 [Ceraceosorus guamensis]PWN46283.1 hypothetical protein IE81DRAFT_2818 [Ceraceosorus guamensis]